MHEQSMDTGNIGNTEHKTQTIKTINTKHKTKKVEQLGPRHKTGGKPRTSRRVSSSCFL